MSSEREPTRSRLRSFGPPGLLVLLAAGCASRGQETALLEVIERDAETRASRAHPTTRLAHSAERPIELTESSGLSDYLVYALLNNPGVEAAFNRFKAAVERIPQVRALPDPKFTYRYFIREVETRVGPQQQAVGLAQTFPWFGKLELRADVAAENAHAARQRYEAEKLKVIYALKDAYHEYYYLGRAIAVVKENRDLVEYLEKVARVRYKTASLKHSEVIRAQVELGKLEDRLRSLRDLRVPVVATLNAVMNRPTHAELPFPTEIAAEQMAASDEDVLRWVGRANPALLELDHHAAAARRAIQLASKDYFPDVTLGFDYTQVGSPRHSDAQGFRSPAVLRSISRFAGGMGDAIDAYAIGRGFQPGNSPGDAGKDVWMLHLSMNLPIWHEKYAAGVREARARHLAALSDRAGRQNALVMRAQQVLYEYRNAEWRIDLYRDTLVPKAKQSLRATEAAFRTGSARFLDLIDAERSLLDFELTSERELANRAQRLAELEQLAGRAIPRRVLQSTTRPADDATTQPSEG